MSAGILSLGLACVLAASSAGHAGPASPSERAASPPQPALVFERVNVIDVKAGRVLADQTVIVAEGRIAAAGPAASIARPGGARVVNARGKYLIPGLWDMHVHAAWPKIDVGFAPLFVANGVVGVRDMYGDMEVIRAWKKKADAGEPWPRMIAAGHILDGPKPFWPGSTVAGNAEEARRAVDALHDAGADFIKVYTRLPREAYVAAAEEAKRVGTYIAGHVPDSVSVSEASDLGQRTIEHLTGASIECSTEAEALRSERTAVAGDAMAGLVAVYLQQSKRILATQDEARCGQMIVRLARNGTWQVPTLVTLRNAAFMNEPKISKDPRLRYVPEEVAESWDWHKDPRFRARTPEHWALAKDHYRRGVDILRAMHRAGVPILAGTDVLNPFAFPGFSLHDELVLLVEGGLTPAEALRAATLSPAIFRGVSGAEGAVETGKRADLVLLDGNPLDDISRTRKVRAVVLSGRYFDRPDLDALLKAAERK